VLSCLLSSSIFGSISFSPSFIRVLRNVIVPPRVPNLKFNNFFLYKEIHKTAFTYTHPTTYPPTTCSKNYQFF
jgi:hypothetical protein